MSEAYTSHGFWRCKKSRRPAAGMGVTILPVHAQREGRCTLSRAGAEWLPAWGLEWTFSSLTRLLRCFDFSLSFWRWLSIVNTHQRHLEGLRRHRWRGPPPVSDSINPEDVHFSGAPVVLGTTHFQDSYQVLTPLLVLSICRRKKQNV